MADLRFKARSVYLGNKVSVWLLQELEMSIMSLSTQRVWNYYRSHHPPATSEVYVVKSVCMHAHMCKNVKDGWGEKNGHLVNLPNVTNSFAESSLPGLVSAWARTDPHRVTATGSFFLKSAWCWPPGGPWEEQTAALGMLVL